MSKEDQVSINGMHDVNHALTCAMHATISALISEGLLTHDQANAFQRVHVAQLVTTHSLWETVRKFLGLDKTKIGVYITRIVGDDVDNARNPQINTSEKAES